MVNKRKALRSVLKLMCIVGCECALLVVWGGFMHFFACWATPGRANYIGWTNCARCHEEIAAKWQLSGHARAFESLKKLSQENLPACISCHVTGYERPGGFIDIELTHNLVGVQCEECHGPGEDHAAAPYKNMTILAKPGVETCRRCHTPGQDPNFDYQKKVMNIHAATGSATKVGNQKVLAATPQYVYFGVVDEGVPATTTIVLENLSDNPIKITGIRTN